MTIVVGSHVWVESSEVVWTDGEVLKINGEEAEIQTTDGNTVIELWLLQFVSFGLFICF